MNIVSENWEREWGIYPNLGIGEPSPNGNIKTIYSDNEFLRVSKKAIASGATIVGGCCGSSPKHIKLLKESFK